MYNFIICEFLRSRKEIKKNHTIISHSTIIYIKYIYIYKITSKYEIQYDNGNVSKISIVGITVPFRNSFSFSFFFLVFTSLPSFSLLPFLSLLFHFSSKYVVKARKMYITNEKLSHRNVDLDREKSELSFFLSFIFSFFFRVCMCGHVTHQTRRFSFAFSRTDGNATNEDILHGTFVAKSACASTPFVRFSHYTLISFFIMENYEGCLSNRFSLIRRG